MIGSLMILFSALFSKSKRRRTTVPPDDAYRRETWSDCALQCHLLEKERENAPLQRASIWTETQNMWSHKAEKKRFCFFFFLCERYLLKGHGWKQVTEQIYEEEGSDWPDQTDYSMSSESLEK